MGNQWQQDKAESDLYLPTIKAICGYYFIDVAPYEEDALHNTDLMVLNINGVRVACRVRTPKFWYEKKNGRYCYRGEFTIRWSRPKNTEVEFKKIIEGWGNYFFYGFAYPTPPKLLGFGILNLESFRNWAKDYYQMTGKWPGKVVPTPDGEKFRAIRWAEVPPASILVSYPKDIAGGIALAPEDLRRAYQLTMEYIS